MSDQSITPAELAVEIWGQSERGSRSRGARRVRTVARKLYPHVAHERWQFTAAQTVEIRRHI